MSAKLQLQIFSLVAAAVIATGAHASTTIADWTFENTQPSGPGPILPEIGIGSALGSHASGAAVYSSPAGNGSSHSFSSNTWAVGDYDQFTVSTAGLDDIALSWDQTSSNTGPKDFELEYSTNGTTFTSVESYSVLANASPNVPWTASSANPAYTFTDNLTSILNVDNASSVTFRLVDTDTSAAGGGSVGTAGTDRVDNFTVTGSAVAAVPLPAPAWLLSGGLLGLFAIRRRAR